MTPRIVGQELPHAAGLMVERLSRMMWISRRGGWRATRSERNGTNSSLVWRAAVLPTTAPVAVSNAAYSDRVPCR